MCGVLGVSSWSNPRDMELLKEPYALRPLGFRDVSSWERPEINGASPRNDRTRTDPVAAYDPCDRPDVVPVMESEAKRWNLRGHRE